MAPPALTLKGLVDWWRSGDAAPTTLPTRFIIGDVGIWKFELYPNVVLDGDVSVDMEGTRAPPPPLPTMPLREGLESGDPNPPPPYTVFCGEPKGDVG